MNPPSVPATAPALDAWDVIDQSIDELTRLARESTSTPAFHTELLRRVIEALAARRATVWTRDADWSIAKTATGEFEFAGSPTNATSQVLRDRAQIVALAAERAEPLTLLPRSLSDDDSLTNPTDGVLLVCPWSIDAAPRGALEVELRAATSPEARQGAARLLATFAQTAADHERNRQRLEFKAQATAGAELDTVATAIYAAADLQAAAYALANEGRRWLGSDRASVLRFDGKRSQTIAVSGVDAVDRRAETVQRLERLATAVAIDRTDLDSAERVASPAPPVERALADYVEVSEAREVAVLLLREAREPARDDDAELNFARKLELREEAARVIGALVVEQFTGPALDDVARTRMMILRRHGSAAISHAADLESIPLGRFWRRFAKHRTERRRRWTKIGIVVGLLAIVGAIPFFIPAPFTVEARGTLEPSRRWDLFAPTSGIVVEIAEPTPPDLVIKMGKPVVRLRKPELELEETRLLGEIRTAERRLATLKTIQATTPSGDAAATQRKQELDAEAEQLIVRLESLVKEQARIDEQKRELEVAAPAAGSITTWDAKRLLTEKPVERGHPLVTFADLNGPWVLELRVPDRHFADVTQARATLGENEKLEVEFIAAADPQTKFTGRLDRLADSAKTDARHGTTIAAVVEIGDGADLDANGRDRLIRSELRRPGASVIAKIHCGTRSLGSIWTDDFLHYLRTRWLF